MNVSVTESNARRLWRQHLIEVAVANEVAEDEYNGESRTSEEREAARYALADLIASATFLETEATGDLINNVADQIEAGVAKVRQDAEDRRAAALLDRWRIEVASGNVTRGFKEWVQDRD